MRISKKTDYALRTLLDLTIHKDEGIITIADIARRQDIPQKFLEQILLQFKGAGMVASRRGQKGGYFLAESPEKISLATVVQLMEGSLSQLGCVSGSEQSGNKCDNTCPFREVWGDIKDYIVDKLEGITMQDMYDRSQELKGRKNIDFNI